MLCLLRGWHVGNKLVWKMTNWKERFWQKNMDRTRAAKDNEKQVIWEEYN